MKWRFKDHDADGRYGSKHAFFVDEDIHKINKENAYIVVIYRDIFYWLVSMYDKPYCKGLNTKKMSFSEYIRHYNNYRIRKIYKLLL